MSNIISGSDMSNINIRHWHIIDIECQSNINISGFLQATIAEQDTLPTEQKNYMIGPLLHHIGLIPEVMDSRS